MSLYYINKNKIWIIATITQNERNFVCGSKHHNIEIKRVPHA